MARNAGFISFIVLISFLIGLPLPSPAAEPESAEETSAKPPDPSQPVASVNSKLISFGQLSRALEDRIPQTGHGSVSMERLSELRGEVLEGLIIEEILYQEARRKKIKVSGEKINEELRLIKERFPSEEAYQRALARRGLEPGEIRQGVERHLMIGALKERAVKSKIKISPKEMKAYYEDHKEQFVIPEQIRLRLLLISVSPESVKEQWLEAREKAEGLLEKARAGEDFIELVRVHSGDKRIPPDKEGDTGLLHRGRLPYKELERVVFDEAKGALGGPVQSLYGYLVYRVEDKKNSEQLSFDQLNKDLLEKEMQRAETQKRLKEWVNGLREKAEIKLF